MSKFKSLTSTTGRPILKYDPVKLAEIQNIDVLRGIVRGYMADPSQINLYPIDPKDLVSKNYKDIFTIMNIIAQRNFKMVDKGKIEEVMNEPGIDISCKSSPSEFNTIKNALFSLYNNVSLDKQGAIDNLPAYYNQENKYFTLRELYKKGVDISDFFIFSTDTSEKNEAEIRDQAKANLENNTAEEIREILIEGAKETPTMMHKARIPLLRDTELPHANDEIKWLVQDIIREGTFNSIIGAAKAGKSQCAMQLSFCLKNGLKFLDMFEVEKSEVLYVDFELEDSEIKRRYDLLREHYKIPNALSPYVFALKNNFTSGKVDMDFIVSEIKKYKKEYPDIKFVVFDCYYTFSHGDSNSEEDVWKTLQPLKALSGADNDLTVLYVHHTNKNGVNTNNAIYASGGSGLHGKVVDTSIVIYPYTTGREHTVMEDIFYVTAVGRTGGFKAKLFDRSEKNGYYFIPIDELDLNTTNAMTAQEFSSKFPKTWELFEKAKEKGNKYIGYNNNDWKKEVLHEFGNQQIDPASILKINKNSRQVYLPKFLVHVDEIQEASNIAAVKAVAEIKNNLEENK